MKPNFSQQWLNVICQGLPDTHSALFVMQEEGGQNILTVARWPESLNQYDDFSEIINYVLNKNEQVSLLNVKQAGQGQYDYFGQPLFIQTKLVGIVLVKSQHSQVERQETIFKALQQGSQWLSLGNIWQGHTDSFYASMLSLMAACFEQATYRETLISLVAELTQSLKCERVALGEYENQHSKVVALSNSAQFDARSNFTQKIADVMDEAIEQDSLIIFPNPQSTSIQRAHQELARKFGSGSILTLPMADGDDIFGAITLLRGEEQPFDSETVRLCRQAVSLLTPFLALKKGNEQSLTSTITKALKKRLDTLFGFKYLKTKLAVVALAGFVLVTGLLKSDFQLTADAVLEGKMQRVVAAPIEGFLVSASVRAGDTVHEGDLMATLDDADLQLELSKLNGQLQKYRREYREALSTNDLVKVRVISAQIDQATAEMELTQQQLQKIALKAPFDSVVIEGDLSQMLGSPVERGDTLFKLAPLEGYRIILKVDESLISYVEVSQKGMLALASMPDRTFELTVQKITAVSKADNKKNIFRVEASLENAPELLRPGMEGIGKINAGRQRLLWIWTHEVVDWLRLWIWSWWV